MWDQDKQFATGDRPFLWRNMSRYHRFHFYLLNLFLYIIACGPTAIAEDGIRDVKPPVSLPEFPWLLLGLGLLVLFVVFGLGYWFYMNRRQKIADRKQSWDLALERLLELRQRDLYQKGQVKELFIAISFIARSYIELRFEIRAPDMTTEEFLGLVKDSSHLTEKQKETLKSFLRLSDMVKFARYGPSADETEQCFEIIQRFIYETRENHTAAVGRSDLQEMKI